MTQDLRPILYLHGYWLMENLSQSGNFTVVAPDGQETHLKYEKELSGFSDTHYSRVYVRRGGQWIKTEDRDVSEAFKRIVQPRVVGGTFDEEAADSLTEEKKHERETRAYWDGLSKGRSEIKDREQASFDKGFRQGKESLKGDILELLDVEECNGDCC